MSIQNSVAFNNAIKACFDVYYNHTNFALTLSSEEQGKLHLGIILEVRSAMTHISRANCAPKINIKKRIEEIKSAQGHFIRAALDGYKIAYQKRMKKIDRRIKLIKQCTPISKDIQKEHDSLKSRRTDLTLEENNHPSKLDTLDNYKDLYIDASNFYDKIITQYDHKVLIRFGFKNIFMHPQWWIFTFIAWILGKYF